MEILLFFLSSFFFPPTSAFNGPSSKIDRFNILSIGMNQKNLPYFTFFEGNRDVWEGVCVCVCGQSLAETEEKRERKVGASEV